MDEVLALHDEQIARFGGGAGMLKPDALAAVLARPLNIFAYDKTADLRRFAAVYLVGLVNGHAFVDGNKRVGLAAMLVFLRLNGSGLHVPPAGLYELVLGVATSRLREDAAAEWLRSRLS
jgi:death-on-curing protein